MNTKNQKQRTRADDVLRYGVGVLACIAPSVLSGGEEPVYRYAIIQIPGLEGGDYEGYKAINDLGHVVGGVDFPGGAFHPVVWDGKRVIDLGTFGGLSGEAWDINNHGEVVGFARDADDEHQAFYWNGGDLVNLGENVFRLSRAYCINDQGQIGGIGAYLGADVGHPVIWDDGKVIVLPERYPDHGNGEVLDINESGIAVGRSWGGPDSQATAWQNGKMMLLGSLGDGTGGSTAWAINDDDVIVGASEGLGLGIAAYACIWINGKIHNISKYGKDLGGRLYAARAINNRGEILGEMRGRRDDKRHPYIYSPERGFELLELLIPPYHEWDFSYFLAFTYDINNHGQIIGTATRTDDPIPSGHSYLLTPIDPELTLEIADGPLQADAINTLRISGAQAGATIKFFYGKKGGGKRIPGCAALEAMTQIDDPVLFGEAIADVDGNAALDIYIPPHGAAHKGFLLQAVDFDHCEESQLVLKKVE